MKLLLTLKDNEFPYEGYDHVRDISRGIVYNDEGEIALIHVVADDIFGHRDLYETPGGGKEKGETNLEAFKREIKEEIGVIVDDIEEIGRVVDYYNLIKRKNNNHFYLGHVKEYLNETHLCDYEKKFFQEIVWVDIRNAITLNDELSNNKIKNIVQAREKPIILKAIKMLKRKGILK